MNAAQALRNARTTANMTLEDVAYESRRLLPRMMWITKSKLSRIESGDVPDDKLDPHTVEFLCHLYGKDVEDVAPETAAALRRYRRALRSRCVATGVQRPLPGLGGLAVDAHDMLGTVIDLNAGTQLRQAPTRAYELAARS